MLDYSEFCEDIKARLLFGRSTLLGVSAEREFTVHEYCNVIPITLQGVVTSIRAILRAATGVTIRSSGHRGFRFAVTGSQRIFQMVTDKILK